MADCGTEDAERRDNSDSSESDLDLTESEEENESESEDDAGDGSGPKKSKQEACKYYNQGKCKKGTDCEYLHVCQYYLSGNCKYGSHCKYRHEDSSDSDNENSKSDKDQPKSTEYQWQVSNGEKWLNIAHDWLLEGQYSLPGAKGINIYNTKYGKICIDFNRMKVLEKNLRVRRKAGKNDKWLWYFRSDSHWTKFGKKDSKGNPSPVTSEDIEKSYQRTRKGSHQFTIGQKQYKICFSAMAQVNTATGTRRSVRRRPLFTATKGDSLNTSLQKLNIKGRLVWQYKGDHGQWHEFKQHKIPCEAEYKQNPQGSMTFSIGNTQYKLDFAAMTQTNLTTGKVRVIRRIKL